MEIMFFCVLGDEETHTWHHQYCNNQEHDDPFHHQGLKQNMYPVALQCKRENDHGMIREYSFCQLETRGSDSLKYVKF